MSKIKLSTLSILTYLCGCTNVYAGVSVPLSVDSVQTKRAKSVLIRVIQYNTDTAALRLESIKPIEHVLLDSVDVSAFTVDGRKYEFSKCDELSVNSVAVEAEQVSAEFECFVPKATAIVAKCSIPIRADKFDAMSCVKAARE
ncbi:MAG TPA: hypothetical protein PK011_14630 [Marinagarivorans sp.]|nr:hypothetical protein [Marinagarivorans sp.]